MATVKKYIDTIMMVMLIALLYYVPIDWLQPYVYPVTILGSIGIVGFAVYTLKKRGLLVLVAGVLLFMGSVSAQAAMKPKDCGGSYKEGGGIAQMLQDSITSGNLIKSDFEDAAVLKCVQENIAAMKGEMCGAPRHSDTYDQDIRSNAFYIMDNYRRMNIKEATGSGNWFVAGFKWAADKMGFSVSDIKDAHSCAQKYADNAAKVDRKNERNCRTIAQTIQKNGNSCWVCDIVQLVLESVQLMAGNTYALMSSFSLALLGVLFLFWIAFRVLKFIGQMGYADNAEFFTDLLMRFITVAIAAAILQTPIIDFYRVAISPFITLSASLTDKFTEMTLTDGDKTFVQVVEEKTGVKMDKGCHYCKDMLDPEFKFDNRENTLEIMDPQSINGILCLTCTSYHQLTPFIAMGESLNCHANAEAYNIPGTSIYIPVISYFIIGYLLVITFSILAVIVGFYLIDIVLRLGFVVVLTPLLITAWAFPISREYSTRGWHLIIYSLLQFLGVAIMISLFTAMCLQIMPGDPSQLITYMADNNIKGVFNVITGIDPGSADMALGAGALGAGALVAASGGAVVVGGSMIILILWMGFVGIAIKMLMATEGVVSNLSGITVNIPGVALAALGTMAKEAMSMAGMGASTINKAGGRMAKKAGQKMQGAAAKRAASSPAAPRGKFKGSDNKSSGPGGIISPAGGPNKGPNKDPQPGAPSQDASDQSQSSQTDTSVIEDNPNYASTENETQQKKQTDQKQAGTMDEAHKKSQREVDSTLNSSEGDGTQADNTSTDVSPTTINDSSGKFDQTRTKHNDQMRRSAYNRMEKGAKRMQEGTLTQGLMGFNTFMIGAAQAGFAKITRPARNALSNTFNTARSRFKNGPDRTIRSEARLQNDTPKKR